MSTRLKLLALALLTLGALAAAVVMLNVRGEGDLSDEITATAPPPANSKKAVTPAAAACG
jgi:hypothetical protein